MPPARPFFFPLFRSPTGAADCSRGWSDAAFGVAQPVGAFAFQHVRPGGAAECRDALRISRTHIAHRTRRRAPGAFAGVRTGSPSPRPIRLRSEPALSLPKGQAGRKNGKESWIFLSHPLSTGSASGRNAAAPLHPWLQSAAPTGRLRPAVPPASSLRPSAVTSDK